jgi:YegS/Rv2252/BmrU family lipid kinase
VPLKNYKILRFSNSANRFLKNLIMADVAFIIDGRKKDQDLLFQTYETYFGQENRVKSFITTHAQHGIRLAEVALQQGFTHVISVGGDGCLHEVVNGMLKAKKHLTEEQWLKIRLGVLPKGSGNDFVRTVAVPENAQSLLGAIQNDKTRLIDVCSATYESVAGGEESRYMANVADVGMGAVVVQKQSAYSKRLSAFFNYQRAIIGTFFTYKKNHIKVTADSFTYEGNVMDFVINNGKYFGNGIGIAPDALPDDGLLSVTLLGDISILDYLRQLPKARKCKKIIHPEIHYHSARELSIESLSGKAPFEIDGEFVGYTPVKVSIEPAALRVLVV